jgi:hypothetical protein
MFLNETLPLLSSRRPLRSFWPINFYCIRKMTVTVFTKKYWRLTVKETKIGRFAERPTPYIIDPRVRCNCLISHRFCLPPTYHSGKRDPIKLWGLVCLINRCMRNGKSYISVLVNQFDLVTKKIVYKEGRDKLELYLACEVQPKA